MSYNPKVRDFLEEKKDLTLMGLYWAGHWRFALVTGGAMFAIVIAIAILEAL